MTDGRMFHYGVDGDEQYITRDRNNYGQGDYDEPSPRGEEHTPLLSVLTGGLLRSGLTLQLGSLVAMFLAYLAFGGNGIFVFDLYAGGDGVRVSSGYHLIASILMFLYVSGAFSTGLFQIFLADNSKYSRGFRVGSKLVASAATLDIVAASLRLTQYLYAFNFMTLKWWAKYQQTSADWSLVHVGSLLHALALGMYGTGFFYTEVYHDEGTNEQFGWLCLLLYTGASIGGLLNVFFGINSLNTIFLLGALFVAANWAYAFEPLMQRSAPQFHSRDLNADILPEPIQNQHMELTGSQATQSNYIPQYGQYSGREEYGTVSMPPEYDHNSYRPF